MLGTSRLHMDGPASLATEVVMTRHEGLRNVDVNAQIWLDGRSGASSRVSTTSSLKSAGIYTLFSGAQPSSLRACGALPCLARPRSRCRSVRIERPRLSQGVGTNLAVIPGLHWQVNAAPIGREGRG